MNFKYTDNTHRVVYRINADGSCESHLVIAKVIQDYLSKGGVIDEAS